MDEYQGEWSGLGQLSIIIRIIYLLIKNAIEDWEEVSISLGSIKKAAYLIFLVVYG